MTPLDETQRQATLDAVDAGFEEQIAFTQELVRHPSLRGREHTAQDFLYDALRARGYALDRWTIDPEEIRDHPGFSPVEVDYANAINVVATHRPERETGRSLILNGHIDVVPEGPHDMWTSPPYEPRRAGDWLYGRGSGDMKAGIAANVFALDALARLGYRPAGRVHLQSVVEEECTGNGALACLRRGYDAEAAIIPEPCDDKLVRANVGVIWFRVHVRGVPTHVREAGRGVNAIEASFHLIQALRRLEAEWNAEKHRYPRFAEEDHPINFNVGQIAGGDWTSSVPAWCSLDCRIAIYPGDDPADRACALERCLREAAQAHPFLANNPPEVAYTGFFARGYELDEGTEAEDVLHRAHAASAGTDLASYIMPAYLDGRVFAIYGGRPCLVYGPVAEAVHGFDERVSLASTRRVTGAIALFIAEWCGLEKAPKR